MLQPVATGTPGHDEQGRKEETPREEPDEVEKPIGREGELVVVVGKALAEKTKYVFVDEVEVPEAMDIADGGMVADRMALIRIGNAGKDMPWGGDCEIEQ